MMAWLIEALIGSALLMLFVLAVRRPVARLWGAPLAYALWALPLVRMLLPAIPGWRPLYVPVAAAQADGDAAVALMPPADAARFTEALPPATLQMGPVGLVPDWPVLLLCLWAAGAALFLAVQWQRHHRFLSRAVASGQRLTTVGNVDVIVSRHVPGPMAAGIVRRRILLPADFLKRYSADERRLALLHEAAHHDRRDLAANLAGLVVLAVHWWNPIAHVAWRAFRADQELACDATVLAGTDADTRAAYGQAVLKSACVATPVAACAMNHKSQLKDRIAMMKDRKLSTVRRLFGGLLMAGVATAALAATASGQPTAPPAPTVPPAPPAAAAAAPAPPPAPAAPRGTKTMLFKHKGAGKDGQDRTVRVIVKDEAKAGPGSLDVGRLERDLSDAVQETRTKDGRHIITVRRRALADGARAAEAGKAAEQAMADVKAEMRADCAKEGITLPADADMGQLAMCGRDIHKEVRQALAAARKAIAEDRNLSDAERTAALKGLDAARKDLRREVIVKIEQ